MTPWEPALLTSARSFAPDPVVAERLATLPSWPAVTDYDGLMNTARLRAVWPSLSFVPQAPRPRRGRAEGPGYDEHISGGRVPTRPRSWHDLFNAMIWAALPAAKRALHERQRAMIAERRALLPPGASAPQARSRDEDALAMIDEGGMLLATTAAVAPTLDEVLTRGDSEQVTRMAQDGQVQPVIFGHALLEHLARGQLGVRGFPVRLVVPALGSLAAIDEALASEVPRVGPPGERPGLPVPARFFGATA